MSDEHGSRFVAGQMRPLVPDGLEALVAYEPGAKPNLAAGEIHSALASNENPFGPSPSAVLAMSKVLEEQHRYPPDGLELRERLAALNGLGVEHVVLGNGSTELINLAVRTFVKSPERALRSETTFVMYKLAMAAAGVPCDVVPNRRDHSDDIEGLCAAASCQTKLVLLSNPNNPTGTYVSQAELERLANALPKDAIILHDEAYREFVTADDYADGVRLLKSRPRVMVMRTFSKAHGLAGVRIGYALADPAIAQGLRRACPPFNINSIAMVAALAALEDSAWLAANIRRCNAARQELLRLCRALGLRCTDSQTNFVLVDLARPADDACNFLAKNGILVRSMSPFGLPHHVRISVGTASNLASLERALTSCLASTPPLDVPEA